MKKTINKILTIYTFIYLIAMHIAVIGIMSYDMLDFNKNMADIVLGVICITVGFILSDFCFLIPSLLTFAAASLLSFLVAISIPVFLILSLFQLCGAESINVLKYGFVDTLLWCIVITPFGILNTISSQAIFNNLD